MREHLACASPVYCSPAQDLHNRHEPEQRGKADHRSPVRRSSAPQLPDEHGRDSSEQECLRGGSEGGDTQYVLHAKAHAEEDREALERREPVTSTGGWGDVVDGACHVLMKMMVAMIARHADVGIAVLEALSTGVRQRMK